MQTTIPNTSLGVGYQIDNQLSFCFGYARLFVRDSDSSNTYESNVPTINHTLNDEYNTKVDIFSAQLNWSF